MTFLFIPFLTQSRRKYLWSCAGNFLVDEQWGRFLRGRFRCEQAGHFLFKLSVVWLTIGRYLLTANVDIFISLIFPNIVFRVEINRRRQKITTKKNDEFICCLVKNAPPNENCFLSKWCLRAVMKCHLTFRVRSQSSQYYSLTLSPARFRYTAAAASSGMSKYRIRYVCKCLWRREQMWLSKTRQGYMQLVCELPKKKNNCQNLEISLSTHKLLCV